MPKRRSAACLGPRLERDLCRYASFSNGSTQAAFATIAAALAIPQLAEAYPVYTPTNVQLTGRLTIYPLDLNGDGIIDIVLTAYDTYSEGSGYFVAYAGINVGASQSGNGVVVNNEGFAIPGKRGELVGSSDPFAQGAELNYFFAEGGGSGGSRHSSGGPWFNLAHRFIGLKFLINGETHYGWLRLNVEGPDEGLLTGYAYETEPNTPITCGFKHYDGTTSTSELGKQTEAPRVNRVAPFSLGALAAGATRLNIQGRVVHSGSAK